MKKLKIGVIMGGMSIEREVSLNSGRTVCDHLDSFFYEVIPLFQTMDNHLFILPWKFLHRGKTADFEHRLAREAQAIKWDDLKNLIDFMYIATHGKYAEDGTLQGLLEVLKIPYLGTKILGSAWGMDKKIQKELLQLAGITVPIGIAITPQELTCFEKNPTSLTALLEDKKIEFPLVVKPNEEGSSLGVSVVFNLPDLLIALKTAASIFEKKAQTVLVEEKIEGMEFCCVILFDKQGNPLPLPPTEVVHEPGTFFHDYTQKYMPGRAVKYTPARVTQETIKAIQKTCLKTTQVLEFVTFARIDGFVKKDGTIVIIDPNSLTGMAPSSFLFNQAAEINMSHTDLINHVIEVELHQQGFFVDKKNKKNESDKKMRVAVLLGGDSNEKETSLNTGRNVCYKLSPHKYEVIPLFVDSKRELYPLTQKLLVHNATAEIEHDLDRSTKINWHDLPTIADFVFIGLHGGIGENGSVQGTLEMLGLPYNGPGIAASALCMNKYKTNNLLKQHGFDVPENFLITKQAWHEDKKKCLELITQKFKFPFIIKPHNDGCSVGVSKIKDSNTIKSAIESIFATTHGDALIEECITGMELTVGVIGNETPQALPPSQAVTQGDILSLEEKFLPGAGENQTPAPLSQEATQLVQKTVTEVFKTVGCSGYSRIDCFYQNEQTSPTKKERVVILEINTVPALTPATCLFHQAAEIGIKPMDFIDLIITFGLQRKGTVTASTVHDQKHQTTITTEQNAATK